MDVDEQTGADGEGKPVTPPTSVDVEVESFVTLLVVVFLADQKKYELSGALAEKLVEAIVAANKRTLDPISAKALFYYSRAHELTNSLASIRRCAEKAHD